MVHSNLKIGDIITAGKSKDAISTWPGAKGGFACKIVPGIGTDWVANSNPNYRGKGLVVFVKRKLEPGEKLKITDIGEKFAKADIVD